jgi:K+-transporting ATPase A subunit
MENKSKNLTAVIVILIAIIAVLGAISAYNFLTVVEKEETTATVIINFGNETLWTFAGIDDEDQRWWQYYVNGELGPVAADRQKVNDGDIIEWK